MALVYDLNNNKFLKNRLQFHAASRVGISVGQALAQATNVDGHIVTNTQIWSSPSEDFPKNTGANKTTSDGVAATENLVSVFKNGNQYEVTHVLTSDTKFDEDKIYYTKGDDGTYNVATVTANDEVQKDTYYETILASGLVGKVYRNDDYPAVELYEGVEMTDVMYSDKQAWEVKTGGVRVMNWVVPTAVTDNGLPIPGFTGIIEAAKDQGAWIIIQKSSNLQYGWELTKGTWQFVPMAGMLIFHPDYIPSKMSYNRLRITAFKYIGEYLSDSMGWVILDK